MIKVVGGQGGIQWDLANAAPVGLCDWVMRLKKSNWRESTPFQWFISQRWLFSVSLLNFNSEMITLSGS
jgi:hypothetical protein